MELFEASASPFVGTATVYDPAGRMRVTIYTGEIADVVAGSGARTVLRRTRSWDCGGMLFQRPIRRSLLIAAVALHSIEWVLTAGLPVSPDGQVQNGLIMLGDRVLTADVLFDGPPLRK